MGYLLPGYPFDDPYASQGPPPGPQEAGEVEEVAVRRASGGSIVMRKKEMARILSYHTHRAHVEPVDSAIDMAFYNGLIAHFAGKPSDSHA